MDERFVTELIEDMEHMRQLLERCVRRLRSQVSANALSPRVNVVDEIPRVSGMRDDIRAEIEKQRQIIMTQVNEIKTQAIQTAASAKGGTPGAIMGATGFGNFEAPGRMGGSPSEVMEELHRKLTEKTDQGDK